MKKNAKAMCKKEEKHDYKFVYAYLLRIGIRKGYEKLIKAVFLYNTLDISTTYK